jgi:pimeloyl-ACP methyl ester carboxylesterase
MKQILFALRFLLLPLAVVTLSAQDTAVPTGRPLTLQGRISDSSDRPMADVRVGLRSNGVSAHTDQNGQFTLTVNSIRPLTKDRTNVYDYLELDKDGSMGRTIDIKDLSFFDHPLAEKMEPVVTSEDRVEFTARMSVDIVLPPISTDKQFNLIGADQWKSFFAGMDSRKPRTAADEGPTEQVVFQAYIPKDAKKLKAVLLITRHGIGSIDHPRVRDFANRNAVALVSVKGNPVQRGFYPVSLIDEPIARLGQMLKHPELGSLPILSFGHSNGTGFAGIFASQRPDRVIAWISYHSGAAFHLQFPGVEKVPGLAMHGLIDPFFKNGQEETVKHLREERNAALAMMLEANVAHGPVDKNQDATWDFIAAFCEAAMRIRLNDDGTLKPVVIEQGWLGANYDRAAGGQPTLAIAPYAAFPEKDRATANWLPDKQFAETWQRYGQTDPRPVK